MKRLVLVLVMYGVALSISLEVRPLFFPPPGSMKEAKKNVVGSWSVREGKGSYVVVTEIEFHSDWTYLARFKHNDEEWNEVGGYYGIDTVTNRATQKQYYAVSLSSAGNGGYLYFKNADELYPEKGRSVYTKHAGLTDGLLWMFFVPCILLFAPVLLLWKRVEGWNFRSMTQSAPAGSVWH